MKEETPLEHWNRRIENTERFLRHKSFCKNRLNKPFKIMLDLWRKKNIDVSRLQQRLDNLTHYWDAFNFAQDFAYLVQKDLISQGIQTPYTTLLNTKRTYYYINIEYEPTNWDDYTSKIISVQEDFADNLKTTAVNKLPYGNFAVDTMVHADDLKQLIKFCQNKDFKEWICLFEKITDNIGHMLIPRTYGIKYIHYYLGGVMTQLKNYPKDTEEETHKDIQDIIDLYERHPEYRSQFNKAAKYFSSLNLKENDLDLLVTNYFKSTAARLSELNLPPMDFGPDCESLPLYGGIFIDGNEEQISNVKDVIQNSEKRIKAQFYKCISDTNKKLKKEIEKIFYELCKKEYMDCNIDNLYIFTYILTKYTPFGKKIDMRPIFWGKSEEDGNGTLKIRDKDRAVLYYFFAVVFKEIDGSKQSRLQNTKSLFCLDHSAPDHPIDEEVSDSEFPVYKGHPHRYIAYNDYSRIPSDMVKVINDFAKNINTLKNQCFAKLKKLSTQE